MSRMRSFEQVSSDIGTLLLRRLVPIKDRTLYDMWAKTFEAHLDEVAALIEKAFADEYLQYKVVEISTEELEQLIKQEKQGETN